MNANISVTKTMPISYIVKNFDILEIEEGIKLLKAELKVNDLRAVRQSYKNFMLAKLKVKFERN